MSPDAASNSRPPSTRPGARVALWLWVRVGLHYAWTFTLTVVAVATLVGGALALVQNARSSNPTGCAVAGIAVVCGLVLTVNAPVGTDHARALRRASHSQNRAVVPVLAADADPVAVTVLPIQDQ